MNTFIHQGFMDHDQDTKNYLYFNTQATNNLKMKL